MIEFPPASEHDPDDRAAEGAGYRPGFRYPLTVAYLCLLVTIILLALLLDWRL